MSMRVTIVGSAHCGACIFTKRAFELAGLPHEMLDVDQDEAAAAIAREGAAAGERLQLPVVICENGDRWTGLRLDRIADLVRAA